MVENKKNTLRLTESELKKIIHDCVQKVIKENSSQEIVINGPASTVTVMEYVRDNGLNTNELKFVFKNDVWLFIQPYKDLFALEDLLDTYPLNTWHDVLGMKRIKTGSSLWVCYINKKFYLIDKA